MTKKKLRPKVLTIAGSDPSGGAGIQADLRTFQRLGLESFSIITAVTAQNEKKFLSVNPVSAKVLRDQLASIGKVDFVKIGMLGTKENVQVVIDYLKKTNPKVVVLDPVFCSSTGRALLTSSGILLLKNKLLPLCALVTPNLQEAEILTGQKVRDISAMKTAAQDIQKSLSLQAVLIKGGHLKGSATDLLYDGKSFTELSGKRFAKSFHGTGCVLSSAILAYFTHVKDLKTAVLRSKVMIDDLLKQLSR